MSIRIAALTACTCVLLSAQVERVSVDLAAPAKPFPHFWEQMFGSGRAVLSLRQSYRDDLRTMKQATEIGYVRFHAIFHDENGVYSEDASGKPVYNWSYVDQIYDGLLDLGVRPFVELSFMPRKLAVKPVEHPFWYKQIVAPPRDYARWGELIEAFARHLVERYGLNEVAEWPFEVWNEPNIDFWAGDPKQQTYFQLYRASAEALKRVNPRLRVGGPATAQAAWVDQFISWCHQNRVPVDFVSTHVYANDTAKDVFGTDEKIPRRDMVARAIDKVYKQVKASPMPSLPIYWTEYNASYMNEVNVTDSPFMGPWLANLIREADGKATMLSYWTFSDVFEEQGVVKTPFYGGFGVIAAGGIRKAAYNAFALLHRLGESRIPVDSTSVLATKTAGSTASIAVWNYAEPSEPGTPRTFELTLRNLPRGASARVTVVGPNAGSPLAVWEKMGRPAFPTRKQQDELREAGELPIPVPLEIKGESVELTLPPHCLALIEVGP